MVVRSGYVPTVAVAVNHSGIPSACIHGHSYFLAVVLNLLTMADKHKMVIREDEIPKLNNSGISQIWPWQIRMINSRYYKLLT